MSNVPKMQPAQYSAEELAGTSTGDAVAFGFNATYIRLVNRGNKQAYFDLGSTGLGTTGGASLSSGEVFSAAIPPCAGFGLATASTSTGDGIDVLALG